MAIKRGGRFLIKQREYLKLYLLKIMEENPHLYGTQIHEKLKEEFHPLGYTPSESEIYKSLYELTDKGILYRVKQLRGQTEGEFQEVVYYRLTSKAPELVEQYRKQVKEDLEFGKALIAKAISDHY
ncbi:MAG TPA: Replication termination protein [Bacillota bacterium]|nr:Replication termination protein [Bacillota bacterium]